MFGNKSKEECKVILDSEAIEYDANANVKELRKLCEKNLAEKSDVINILIEAEIDYDSEMTLVQLKALLPKDTEPTEDNKPPADDKKEDEKPPETKGVVFKPVSKQQNWSIPHMLDGEFAQHGIKKYYIAPVKNAETGIVPEIVRVGNIMAYKDGGAEVGYRENLFAKDVETMRKSGYLLPKPEK